MRGRARGHNDTHPNDLTDAMHALAKALLVLATLACSACSRAEPVEARRDHILAADHGWVDVTLHAAPAAAASAAAAGTACAVAVSINGEAFVRDSIDLAAADAARSPIGYRFAVPAGRLDAALHVTCGQADVAADLPLDVVKNQVSTLEFDGAKLALVRSAFLDPASMDSLRGDLLKMQDASNSSYAVMARMTQLLVASIVLNVLVIVVVFATRWRRRRGAAG